MHHGAGNSGFGGASYIDQVATRDRDTDDNGSLEERILYCQNWRHDVVAIVDSGGAQLEMVRYSAYGVPFGLPGGDTDSDGDCDKGDTVDTAQIQSWIDGATYDVRGDMDLDGDVDANDKSIAKGSPFNAVSSGWRVLTGLGNRRGYASYQSISAEGWMARRRLFRQDLGSWTLRDSIPYADGLSLYEYSQSNPVGRVDPSGAASTAFDAIPIECEGHSTYAARQGPVIGCGANGNEAWAAVRRHLLDGERSMLEFLESIGAQICEPCSRAILTGFDDPPVVFAEAPCGPWMLTAGIGFFENCTEYNLDELTDNQIQHAIDIDFFGGAVPYDNAFNCRRYVKCPARSVNVSIVCGDCPEGFNP